MSDEPRDDIDAFGRPIQQEPAPTGNESWRERMNTILAGEYWNHESTWDHRTNRYKHPEEEYWRYQNEKEGGKFTPPPVNETPNTDRPPTFTEFAQIPQNHRDFAILADAGSKFFEKSPQEADAFLLKYDSPYVINHEFSNDLGLVVTNKNTGKSEVVFRGTYPLDAGDIWFDTTLIMGYEMLSPQYWQTKAFMDRAVQNFEIENCVSYSKGASHCGSWAEKYGIDTISFNPAFAKKDVLNWMPGANLDNIVNIGSRPNRQSHHTVYRTPADIVSIGTNLTNQYTHPNLTVHNIKQKESFFHDIKNFYDVRY